MCSSKIEVFYKGLTKWNRWNNNKKQKQKMLNISTSNASGYIFFFFLQILLLTLYSMNNQFYNNGLYPFLKISILYFMNKKGIFGLGVDCRIYRVNWKWKSFPLSLFEYSTITSCQMFFCFPYKITKILNGKHKTHDILQLVQYKIEHKKKDIWFLLFSKN